jgi:hypothetical protein
MTDTRRDLTDLVPETLPIEEPQRLLLFAMRRMAAGGLADAHAANALLTGFGLSFRRPLVLLRALMAEVSRVSKNRILVAPCCCPRMTGSEAVLLATVSDARADPRGAHDRLVVMLGVVDCLGAIGSAQAVAQAFEDLGRPLG